MSRRVSGVCFGLRSSRGRRLLVAGFAAVLGLSLVGAVPPVATASPPKSTGVDPRTLPLLPAPAPQAEHRAGPKPGADFTPLASDGGSRFDPKRSKLVSRSMFVEEYENPDGTHTVKQATEPLNVQDQAGKWQPVDTTLAVDAKTGRVKAKRHPLNASLGAQADDPSLVSVEVDGAQVSLGVERVAKGRKAKVTGTKASYSDIASDTDLKYEVTPGAVKETIVLRKAPERGKASWRFTLRTGALTPTLTSDGAVVLADRSGATKLVMPPIQTWDSSGTEIHPPAETGGTYQLEKVADGWVPTSMK